MRFKDYTCILCLIFSFLLFQLPIHINQIETIQGTVYKTYENYVFVKTRHGNIKLYTDEPLEYNDYIKATVKYLPIKTSRNDYSFDEITYLKGQKIFMKASIKKLMKVEHHYGLYHFLDKRLSKDNKSADYQRLLVLGERSEGVSGDYKILSSLSLVHLFALSGLHIHLLNTFIVSILGLFTKHAKKCSLLLLGIYVFSIPISISLLRAYFLLVLDDLCKEHLSKLDQFSLLVIISLIYNPYIFYNISFIFSYLVYFIVIITKHIKNSFIYIYLSTIPVVLYLNHAIPLFAIILTPILSPFITVFYIFAHLSLYFKYFEFIFIKLSWMLEIILKFLSVSQFTIAIGTINLSYVIFYYVIYFLILYYKDLKLPAHKYVLVLLSLNISYGFYMTYKPYGQITMIDVGQGDCTLIRLPYNKGNILIDTGGNKDYDLAQNTIIPYLKAIGIHSLDYVYISHYDYDHSGALESLKENFSIKEVIDDYQKDKQIGDVMIHMYMHHNYEDENDASIVMKVIFPSFSILFTGDASVKVEEELIKNNEDLRADILKVSHHGSITATSPAFLNSVHPDVAMIGVGEHNLYHHPHDLIINRLLRKGITILRTDEDGMFHIKYNHDNYFIEQ